MNGEAELNRLRADTDRDDAARRPPPTESGGPSLLVKTKAGTSYPTTANCFYLCDVIAILGAPTEGHAATTLAVGDTVGVYNIGGSVPVVGTLRIATPVPHRWIMQYD